MNPRIKIDSLPLSTRAKNTLKSEGLQFLDEVEAASDAELLKCPNLGRDTLREIRAMQDVMRQVARNARQDDLRDMFAAAALTGLIAAQTGDLGGLDQERSLSAIAFDFAEAMLSVRARHLDE